MILIPYEKIVYKTKLSHDEVIQRLRRNVEPTIVLDIDQNEVKSLPMSYKGIIEWYSFEIQRIISNRNSYNPRIFGKIEDKNQKVYIKVTIRPSISSLFFSALWLAFVFYFFYSMVLSKPNPDFLKVESLIPLGMLLFGYIVPMVRFYIETTRSKKYLAQLFESTSGESKREIRRKRYLK